MKKIKNKFNGELIFSFILIILGLALFINPNLAIDIVSYITASILLFLGVISCIKYFKNNNEISTFDFDLVYGVLVIIFSIYLFIKPNILETIFNIILGIYIIINAITKFEYSLLIKKVRSKDFKYVLLLSVIMFILGIILLINPLKTYLLITQIIGIFMIIYSVLSIINNFIVRRNVDLISSYDKFIITKKEDKNENK